VKGLRLLPTNTFQSSSFVRIVKMWNYVCKFASSNSATTLSPPLNHTYTRLSSTWLSLPKLLTYLAHTHSSRLTNIFHCHSFYHFCVSSATLSPPLNHTYTRLSSTWLLLPTLLTYLAHTHSSRLTNIFQIIHSTTSVFQVRHSLQSYLHNTYLHLTDTA
jgi:hypothetical protein